MTQQSMENPFGGGELDDQHSEFPHDAERFAVGLEDDHRLSGAWLIAGVLSEAALIGMLITSLQEPGRAASVVLVLVVALLGLAMGVHLVRCRIDGQPRASSRQPGYQPAGRRDARRQGRPTIAKAPPWHKTAGPAGSGNH